MSTLLAFNKTTSPLALAAGSPVVTLPAAETAGVRALNPVDVTAELSNLTLLQYQSLDAQRALFSVDFVWTGDPRYPTPGLVTYGPNLSPLGQLRGLRTLNASGVAGRRFVAVRHGGSDTNGVVSGPAFDNSGRAVATAAPFATVQAALSAAFNALNDQQQLFIDLSTMTGADKIVINSASTILRMLPCMDNLGGNNQPSNALLLNPYFGNVGAPTQSIPTEGMINFFADPTVLDTIASGEITSTTVDSVTGQKTLVTTKSYTSGQYEGKVIYGSGIGERAFIASCSAGPNSQLELTTNGTLTAPLTIADFGCEIQNTGVPAFFFLEGAASTKFIGINFNPSTNTNVFNAFHTAYIGGTACRVGAGLQAFRSLFFEPETFFFDGSAFSGSGGSVIAINGTGMRLNNCYAKYIDWNARRYSYPQQMGLMIFDNCSPVGHGNPNAANNAAVDSLTAVDQSAGPFILKRSKIRNGRSYQGFPGYGLYYAGGDNARVENTTINNCADDGVHADGGRLTLINVQGSGNGGYGVRADKKADVQTDVNTTVTGTLGDMKSGGKPVRTWSDYRSATPANSGIQKDEHDVPASFRQPRKYVFSGLSAANSFDLTTLTGGEAMLSISTLRVVTGSANTGPYQTTDAGGTPFASAGGALGVATLSDDGKTLTFPAGTLATAFTLEGIPVPPSTTGSRIWE